MDMTKMRRMPMLNVVQIGPFLANAETVELLQDLLARALSGEIVRVAAVTVGANGVPSTCWSHGNEQDHYRLVAGIQTLSYRMQAEASE